MFYFLWFIIFHQSTCVGRHGTQQTFSAFLRRHSVKRTMGNDGGSLCFCVRLPQNIAEFVGRRRRKRTFTHSNVRCRASACCSSVATSSISAGQAGFAGWSCLASAVQWIAVDKSIAVTCLSEHSSNAFRCQTAGHRLGLGATYAIDRRQVERIRADRSDACRLVARQFKSTLHRPAGFDLCGFDTGHQWIAVQRRFRRSVTLRVSWQSDRVGFDFVRQHSTDRQRKYNHLHRKGCLHSYRPLPELDIVKHWTQFLLRLNRHSLCIFWNLLF